MSWILDQLAAQRAGSSVSITDEDLNRAEKTRQSLAKISLRHFSQARPSRVADYASGEMNGGWSEEPNSGFSFPPMAPSNLLDDPEANVTLDAQATALIAAEDEFDAIAAGFLAADNAARAEKSARQGAARKAAQRAKQAKIIADLLDAGHTGPSVFAVILASGQYATAKDTDPTWEIPAWVADEIRRQRP